MTKIARRYPVIWLVLDTRTTHRFVPPLVIEKFVRSLLRTYSRIRISL